ncbi:MAG: DUF5060 domain-containing protein [Myxococcota bacterium]
MTRAALAAALALGGSLAGCTETLVLGAFPGGGEGGGSGGTNEVFAPQTVTRWAPFLEWSITSTTWTGDPYTLPASVTFVHDSGAEHTTPMFYAGDDVWRVRFCGTELGGWTWRSSSEDPDLDDRTGTIEVIPNPDPDTTGFVTSVASELGTHWARPRGNADDVELLAPQLVMMPPPAGYRDDPTGYLARVDAFLEQGFAGIYVHTVGNDWLADTGEPNPATFEALEAIIVHVHGAGGWVHVWGWDTSQRPEGGVGEASHARLLRTLAARLGPLPGWTLGYGQAQNWLSQSELLGAVALTNEALGWPHLQGGRAEGPQSGPDHSAVSGWNNGLGYAAYAHFAPDYDVYVAAMADSPQQPVLSADRFRVRDPVVDGDPTFDEIPLRLWQSAIAGGVANIWANFLGGGSAEAGSDPFPPEVADAVTTYARFWRDRLRPGLRRTTVDGAPALRSLAADRWVVLAVDRDALVLDLSPAPGAVTAFAIDIALPYAEVPLGTLDPGQHDLSLPYAADWAIALEP